MMAQVGLNIITPGIVRIWSNPCNIGIDALNIAIWNMIDCYDDVTNKFWLDDGFLDVGTKPTVYFNYEEPYYEYVDGMPSHEIPEACYFTLNP